MEFTHINRDGGARMVDVSDKADTVREALAYGCVYMKRETLEAVKEGAVKKGDVLSTARIGGIMGAKLTPHIIPMCHPIMITGCDISLRLDFTNNKLDITAQVKNTGKTGVEMEALTAVSITALTVYDMCKSVDKGMTISNICLVKKSGGKSGTFEREDTGWQEWLPLTSAMPKACPSTP